MRSPKTSLAPAGLWPAAAMALAVVLVFAPVTWQMVFRERRDYPQHLGFARTLAEAGIVRLPHSGFQQMTVAVRALMPLQLLDAIEPSLGGRVAAKSFELSAFLLSLGAQVLLGLLILGRLRNALPGPPDRRRCAGCFVLALALLLVAPIYLPTVEDRRLYLGYIGITVYHNPTVTLLRPLAFLLFLELTRPLSVPETWPRVGFLCLLTLGSSLVKPSYTICLLPALAMAAMAARWLGRRLRWREGMLGFALPATLMLCVQFRVSHLSEQIGAFVWAPLQAVSFWAAHGKMSMFMLSIAFPLAVLVCYAKRAWEDYRLALAWAGFLVGALLMYGAAESGHRLLHLNFSWGAQVTLFILFIESLRYYLLRVSSDVRATGRWWAVSLRRLCPAAALAAHVFCGLGWHHVQFDRPARWWGAAANSQAVGVEKRGP